MRHKNYDELLTYTPIEEIKICENCPYDDCKFERINACDYYKNQKRKGIIKNGVQSRNY